MSRSEDLLRIRQGLQAAVEILRRPRVGTDVGRKASGDPVTDADRAVDRKLRELLPRPGEGWLSEETADDPARLECPRVWVVDPLDGTREFVQDIPEWCVSIGLVEEGRAVAGGICNPSSDQLFLGSVEGGVTVNGRPARMSDRQELEGATVLASRTEVGRGQWDSFRDQRFAIRPLGSVAYKLALVAAGLGDLTWTLVPKHEWDVAAGTALVTSAGGEVWDLAGTLPSFNQPSPRLTGLVATPPQLSSQVRGFLAPHLGSD